MEAHRTTCSLTLKHNGSCELKDIGTQWLAHNRQGDMAWIRMR
jgi:hypothetical protein